MEDVTEKDEVRLEKGKNPFFVDGALGRKGFIFSLLAVFVVLVILLLISSIVKVIVPGVVYRVFSVVLRLLSWIVLIYYVLITYIKRLYDLCANKRKAIFYGIAYTLAINFLSVIPGTKSITFLIASVVLLALVVLPGKS
jgi:hypothetical protein